MGSNRLGDAEDGLEVGIQDLIPLSLVGGEDGAEVGVGGSVVDGDVHPTEALHRPLDHRLHLVGVPHVGLDRQRLPACGPDLLGHLLYVLQLPAAHRHLRASLGKPEGDGPPDAARRAGDDGDLSSEREFSHRLLLLNRKEREGCKVSPRDMNKKQKSSLLVKGGHIHSIRPTRLQII